MPIDIHDQIIITSRNRQKVAGNPPTLGLTIKETIGIAIINPKGIARIKL